jgi:hypothetical protein
VAGIMHDVDVETREAIEQFEIFPKPFSAVDLIAKVKEVLLKCSRIQT